MSGASASLTPTRNAIGLSSLVGVQSTDGVGELSPWRSNLPPRSRRRRCLRRRGRSPRGLAHWIRIAASAATRRLPLEGGGKTRHELAPPTCADCAAYVSLAELTHTWRVKVGVSAAGCGKPHPEADRANSGLPRELAVGCGQRTSPTQALRAYAGTWRAQR